MNHQSRRFTAARMGAAAAMAVFALGSAPVRADFVGLKAVLEFPSANTLNGPRDVYHVFAEFTNPADRVNTWYGTAVNPFTIQNVLADGVTLGSGFTNFGGPDSQLPPKAPGGSDQWDTFATIGVRFQSEEPPFSAVGFPGAFPQFIPGNSVTSSNGVISTVPASSVQGQADFRVTGGDTSLRVLLMQLTVNVGEHVRGTINLDGQRMTGSGYQSFTALGATFNSVPAPGMMALLLVSICSVSASRRRRYQSYSDAV